MTIVRVESQLKSAIDLADRRPTMENFRVAVGLATIDGIISHPSTIRLGEIARRDGSTATILAAAERVVSTQTPWLPHIPRVGVDPFGYRVKLAAGVGGSWMHAVLERDEDALRPAAVHAYDPARQELVELPLRLHPDGMRVDDIMVRLMPDERRSSLAFAVAGIAVPDPSIHSGPSQLT
jgi:hypothetical protein